MTLMEELKIEANAKTPEVHCRPDGTITLKGKSIPEHSVEFYKPVYDWLDAYAAAPAVKTTLEMEMEYFNTSSSKCLLDIFRKLEPLQASGKSEVTVKWRYEEADEDMMEAGEDYQTIVKLGFELQQV